jgi:formylglycine-generating enzyme required for sulfatase activity
MEHFEGRYSVWSKVKPARSFFRFGQTMKLFYPTSLCPPRLNPRTGVGYVLHTLLFFCVAISPALAESASSVGLARNPVLRLLGEERASNGTFRFFFDAKTGQSYPVEVSPDLVHWSWLTNGVGDGGQFWVQDETSNFQQRYYHVGIPNMVFIKPGVFTMGSPSSESNHSTNEAPQTIVTLSQGFWIGRFEVTQEEYMSVTGSATAFFFFDPKLPVDFAKWSNATNYCEKLNQRETVAGRLPAGYFYRLPTEAEWEYACRAGSALPFGVGTGDSLGSTQANFDGSFPYGGAPKGPFLNKTTVGGTYAPNAWGLYDMHGNVWEWCQDIYGPYPGGSVSDPKGAATGSTRVLRGGGFTSVGHGCRSAKRDNRSPEYANFGLGFRVVLARDL